MRARAGLAGYLVGLTYVSKVEDTWSQDADSEARNPLQKTRDFVLRYGPAVLVLLPLPSFGLLAASLLAGTVLALFAGWTAYNLSFVYRSTERNIGGAIGGLIAGISLLDALILGAAGADSAAVFAALLAFAATHTLQRYVKGT